MNRPIRLLAFALVFACSTPVDIGDLPDSASGSDAGSDPDAAAPPDTSPRDAGVRPTRPTSPVSVVDPVDAPLMRVTAASLTPVGDALLLVFLEGTDLYAQRLERDGSPLDARPFLVSESSRPPVVLTSGDHAIVVYREPRAGVRATVIGADGTASLEFLSPLCESAIWSWNTGSAGISFTRLAAAVEGDRMVVAVLEDKPRDDRAEPISSSRVTPLLCVGEFRFVDGAFESVQVAERELPETDWAPRDPVEDTSFSVGIHDGRTVVFSAAAGRLERWFPFDPASSVTAVASVSALTTLSNLAIRGDRALLTWADWPDPWRNGTLRGLSIRSSDWTAEDTLELGDTERPHQYTRYRGHDEIRPKVVAIEDGFMVLPPVAFAIDSYSTEDATYDLPDTGVRIVRGDDVETAPLESTLGSFDIHLDGTGGRVDVRGEGALGSGFNRELRIFHRAPEAEWSERPNPSVALDARYVNAELKCNDETCVAAIAGYGGVAATVFRTLDGSLVGERAMPITSEQLPEWVPTCLATDGSEFVIAWAEPGSGVHRVYARTYAGEWSDPSFLFETPSAGSFSPSISVACEFDRDGELVIGYGDGNGFFVYAPTIEGFAVAAASERRSHGSLVRSAAGPDGTYFVTSTNGSVFYYDGALGLREVPGLVADVVARDDGGVHLLGFAAGTFLEAESISITTIEGDGSTRSTPVEVGVFRYPRSRARLTRDGDGLLVAFERSNVERETATVWGDAFGSERSVVSESILDIDVLGDGSRAVVYQAQTPGSVPRLSEIRFRIVAAGSVRLD